MQNKHKLLLMSDTAQDGGDPFAGVSLGDVDTSFPRLRAGTYDMIVRDAQPFMDKEDSTKQKGISFKLELNEDGHLDTNGNAYHKGGKFIQRIYGASGKRPVESVQRDCAFLVKSALGLEGAKSVNMSEFWKNPGKFIDGKVVKAKVKVRPASTNKETGQTYEEQNEATFIPPAQ